MTSWLRISDLGPSAGMIGLTISILTIILTYICVMYFKNKRMISMIDKIPGPIPFAIIERSQLLTSQPIEVFNFVYGFSYIWSLTTSIYRMRFGNMYRINLVKARAAEVILSSSKHLNKSNEYRFLHPWLGTGLLTSSGRKWQSRRKLLTPAFHFKILEDFVEVFNNQSKTLVMQLNEKADGNAFNIFPFITLCTLDIICETAMGCRVHAQENKKSEYVTAVVRMTSLILKRVFKVWQHPEFAFKLLGYEKQHKECLDVLHGFTQNAIRERRKVNEDLKKCTDNSEDQDSNNVDFIGKKKKKLLAFLDLLLEYTVDGNPLSDAQIQEEVDTFMFEGHDTTTTAINWFLYFMGSEPQIQSKVHEELDSIFGDSDRPATIADLRELKYLDRCIKESLRLFPSVPFVGRQTTEDAVIEGYHIPAGSTVQVCVYRMHRDPEQFPKPHVFDPDRFLPENCEKRHPFAYVPFSAGPRNCIGQKFAMMEEKIILSTFLRNFRVESTIRREDLKIISDLILRTEDGNMVKLFPRTTKI